MKSDQPAKKKPAGKVFDVRRPGRAPASATSKPVIVGHKPEVKDPDVKVKSAPVAADVAADVPATTPTDDSTRMMLGTHKKIDIKPVGGETITVTKKPSSKTPTEASVDALDEAPAKTEPTKEEPKDEAPAADQAETAEPAEEPAADVDGKADIDADVPADEEPASEVSDALAQVAIDGTEEAQAEEAAEPAADADATPSQPAAPAATPEAPPETPAAQPAPERKPDVQPPATPAPKPAPTTDLTTTTSKPEEPTAANAEVESDEDLSVSEDDMAGPEEGIFVSHHDAGGQGWKVTLLILIMIFLLLVAFDILLDGGIVTIKGLPHTNFFSSLQ